MQYRSLIKFAIICFIVYALYSSNAELIKNLATKASHGINALKSKSTAKVDDSRVESNVATAPKKQEPRLKANVDFKISSNEDSFVENVAVNLINKVLDNPNGRMIFEEVVNKMVLEYHGALGGDVLNAEYVTKDLSAGSGDSVRCGDAVEVAYSIIETNKDKMATDSVSPIKAKEGFIIGSGKLNRLLENGIIGMKKGGVRKIIYGKATSKTNSKTPNKVVVAEVALSDLKRNKKTTPTKIFIEKADYPGQLFGPKVMCGDIIDASYTLYNLKGKVLYSSKNNRNKIKLKIGQGSTPAIISNGLLGLTKNKSKITLITSAKDIKYSEGKASNLVPVNLGLSDEEMVIVDIDTTAR